MMKLNLNRIVFFMMALAIVSLSFSSCGEDEPEIIEGCTNPKGDSYNPNATNDDGSCTFFDLYVGNWSGDFDCPGLLMPFFQSADLQITEGVAATNDLVSVLVQSTLLTTPVPTAGTITENTLTITQQLNGVSVDFLPVPEGPEVWNIGVNGTLTLNADGTELNGNVVITLEAPALMVALNDNCAYTATKQ